MQSAPTPSAPNRPHLSLWDTVSIIVGIVIGAGIYETPPAIFNNVSSPGSGLALWALAGLLCLCGALCYAELACTYPRTGGDYVYLSRAYGPLIGFLFGWGQLAVIMTGSIGMMAYVFADYAVALWNFGPGANTIYAALSVLVLTGLNMMGVGFGKPAQNALTAAKVLGLGGILAAGLFAPRVGTSDAVLDHSSESVGLALILILYTYGGWSDAAFVASEQSNRQRNIPLALICGILAITGLYCAVNAAYLLNLGFAGVRQTETVAAVVLQNFLGPVGYQVMCLLVLISALGAINGMIFTGSRVYSALGTDHRLFAILGRWHPRRGAPLWSLLAQAGITLVMILLVGTGAGRSGVAAAFQALHLPAPGWGGHGGFRSLLDCTAPIFWLFFLATSLSLFVLRARDQGIPRSFAVPFFPLTPLIFVGTCAYMLYSATTYAGWLTMLGVVPLLAGLPLYWLSQRGGPILPKEGSPWAANDSASGTA